MPIRPTSPRQPWLHQLSVCVDGNVAALSDHAGQIHGLGAEGIYVDDRRIVNLLLVTLDGEQASPVAHTSSGAASDFLASARHLGNLGADPTVELRRHRRVIRMGVVERIVVASRASAPVVTQLLVRVAGDGADISTVKSGYGDHSWTPAAGGDGALSWQDEHHDVRISTDVPGAGLEIDAAGGGYLRLDLHIEPGQSAEVSLTMTATRLGRFSLDADPGSGSVDWSAIRVEAQDSALAPTVRAGLDDLQHLLLTDPDEPNDLFAAAGAPWFLTLFGRDSLWAARMMLPFGTELAAGTLHALARRQGTETHHGRAEAAGKIPHELRRTPYLDKSSGLELSPTYYGTVDATCLWIILLHDAWRWGMPPAQVEALLPNLVAALSWLTDHAEPGSDGLLKYVDTTGTGLANQGWKDSGDSIRWRDGAIADAPIALVEVQAYAVEAAVAGAALLDGFGCAGGESLTEWAGAMRGRVRERFWVAHDEPGGPWLGIAVDGSGRTVDGLASNMGHVLGTGTLDAEESARVAATLTSDPLLDTYGIRTLASDNGGYNPIGYHTGSIWTHDTAICALGLAKAGHTAEAATVARSLLSSSVAFRHHWPELYAGADALDRPAPYPAACHPQAWAAASAAALLSVALRPEPDAQSGRLVLRPCRPAPFGAMTVHGLRFGEHTFAVQCEADGTTRVLDPPPGLSITVE